MDKSQFKMVKGGNGTPKKANKVVDPQQTIEVKNPDLENLIHKYQETRSLNDLNTLTDMLMLSRLLFPAVLVQAGGKKQPMPNLLKNAEGKLFFPVFTSREQLPKGGKGVVVNMPYKTINHMAFNPAMKISGIALNPYTDRLTLNMRLVEKLEKGEKLTPIPEMAKKRVYVPRNADNQPSDPQLTIDVDNTVLEEAIETYGKENNAENLNRLLNILLNARILLPAQEAVIKDQKQTVPVLVKNGEGELLMPIYTSKDKLTDEEKIPAIMNMPYTAVNKMVCNEALKCAGILINPKGKSLLLKKELLLQLEKAAESRNNAGKAAEAANKAITPDQMNPQQLAAFEHMKFEKVFLPEKLFADGQALIDDICSRKEECLDELFEESYENKRMYPYLQEEFYCMAITVSDMDVIRIDFPSRDQVLGCCARAYITWDRNAQKAHYYGIQIEREKKFSIVEVDPEYQQIPRGESPAEGTELQTIIDLAKNQ